MLGLVVAYVFGETALRTASRFNEFVYFLATASKDDFRPASQTLEDYIRLRRDELIPHRNWHNYATNALGFSDVEFREEKTPGVLRVLALGDSFCYGLVPYPANILTLVERSLNESCNRKIEMLNFCVASSGVWDYYELLRLSIDRFRPDVVLLHWYAGNDGPDLLRGLPNVPGAPHRAVRSYLYTFVRNAWRMVTETNRQAQSATTAAPPDSTNVLGGQKIDPALPEASGSEPIFTGPTFNADGYGRIVRDELGRFYKASDAPHIFAPIDEFLTKIATITKEHRARLVLLLYPSLLQLSDSLRERSIETLKKQDRGRTITLTDFDPELPNRELLAQSKMLEIPFIDLTPALRAAQSRGEVLYIKNDAHWNFRGNAVAAAAEAQELRELLCPVQERVE